MGARASVSDSPAPDSLLADLQAWYGAEQPKTYVVCAGLAVLDIMRDACPLTPQNYKTNGNQIRTSGPLIAKILRRFGETRTYSREGGRTTRGTVPAAERLVERMNNHPELATMTPQVRGRLIDAMQAWLVEKVQEYFDQSRIVPDLNLSRPSWLIVADILAAAAARQKAGPVAQHLIGAKLAIRYPDASVENHNYTTADQQLGRAGDFRLGDTVFHVTVAPMEAVLEKCEINIRNGYRVQLLVPDIRLVGTRQLADGHGLLDKIAVQSIETFVGQNIEEIGRFEHAGLRLTFQNLLETYNERVAAVETDRSLLIEIPENL